MAGFENRTCGFNYVKGQLLNSTSIVSDIRFQDGFPYDLIVYVRNGSISASINGKLVSEYKADFSDLTMVPIPILATASSG